MKNLEEEMNQYHIYQWLNKTHSQDVNMYQYRR
jgi:hypothetical protein